MQNEAENRIASCRRLMFTGSFNLDQVPDSGVDIVADLDHSLPLRNETLKTRRRAAIRAGCS